MKYHKLGKSGIEASVISLGAFGLGGGTTWSDTVADERAVCRLLDGAADAGVNVIDTAPVYGLGDSERLLGGALKGRRSRFILQTKCGLSWRSEEGELQYERNGKRVFRNLAPAAVRQDVEDSLRRLDTDYIDIMITHRQSTLVPPEETMGELIKMVEEGKIRAVGISWANPNILDRYLSVGPVALVQEKLSLLDMRNRAQYLPACEERSVAFQAYSPLEAGALCGPGAIGRAFPEGDIRGNFRWFKEEFNPQMETLYKGWEGLCEKYQCSYANLVLACTLSLSPNINLVAGARRPESITDSARAADIEINASDIEKVLTDCEQLVKRVI